MRRATSKRESASPFATIASKRSQHFIDHPDEVRHQVIDASHDPSRRLQRAPLPPAGDGGLVCGLGGDAVAVLGPLVLFGQVILSTSQPALLDFLRFPLAPRKLGLLRAIGTAWPGWRRLDAWRSYLWRDLRWGASCQSGSTTLATAIEALSWRPARRALRMIAPAAVAALCRSAAERSDSTTLASGWSSNHDLRFSLM